MNKTADSVDARNSETVVFSGVRAAQKLAVLVTILGLVGTAALADPYTSYQGGGSGTTHVYDTGTTQPGQVTKTARLKNSSYRDQAFICQGGRNCAEVLCSACHAQPANTKVTVAELKKHAEVYYPRAETRLSEGQTITFAGMKLRRLRASDRMEFIDRNNRRYILPKAMLLKDKTGKPSLIFVPGDTLGLKAAE